MYRGKSEVDAKNITVGNISIDSFKRIVTKNGEIVKLTDKEYALLFFLVEHRGSHGHWRHCTRIYGRRSIFHHHPTRSWCTY